MSKITVIIPMRNEIQHIVRSVKSALQLTDKVYVVDSNSTDGSIEVAENHSEVLLPISEFLDFALLGVTYTTSFCCK